MHIQKVRLKAPQDHETHLFTEKDATFYHCVDYVFIDLEAMLVGDGKGDRKTGTVCTGRYWRIVRPKDSILDPFQIYGKYICEHCIEIGDLKMDEQEIKKELKQAIDAAVKAERERCVQICMEQYIYWRDAGEVESGNSSYAAMTMAAIGTASNILARIEGLISPMVFVAKSKIDN